MIYIPPETRKALAAHIDRADAAIERILIEIHRADRARDRWRIRAEAARDRDNRRKP